MSYDIRRKPPGAVTPEQHGTTTGHRYGCRCWPCIDAFYKTKLRRKWARHPVSVHAEVVDLGEAAQ